MVDGAIVLATPTWRPPEHRILPELLEQGRQAIEQLLVPCGEEGAGHALMPLLLTQEMPKTEGMSETTLAGFYAAQSAEYARHLRHLPPDLLRKACDEHVTACSKFFPSVFEISSKANPELERRKIERDRIKALIASANTPRIPPRPKFEPEPEHVRLLTMLRTYETPGSMLYSSTKAKATRQRLQVLVDAEIDKANSECRSPAAWTTGNESVGVLIAVETPSDWKDAGLSDLLAPKVPRGAPTNTHPITDVEEQPPMPDEIPE